MWDNSWLAVAALSTRLVESSVRGCPLDLRPLAQDDAQLLVKAIIIALAGLHVDLGLDPHLLAAARNRRRRNILLEFALARRPLRVEHLPERLERSLPHLVQRRWHGATAAGRGRRTRAGAGTLARGGTSALGARFHALELLGRVALGLRQPCCVLEVALILGLHHIDEKGGRCCLMKNRAF